MYQLTCAAADVVVSPSSVVLDGASSPLSFVVIMCNSGTVPLKAFLSNISSDFTCESKIFVFIDTLQGNMTGSISLGSGETVVVEFTYRGLLPFASSLSFIFQDTVTEYNLCFSSETKIPMSFSPGTFCTIFSKFIFIYSWNWNSS